MVRGFARSILPLVIALLLLAGGAALGVLQIGWVSAASRAEEERARTAIALGATRILVEAEDEVRVLLSLLRVSAAEVGQGDWTRITADARFWYEGARYPYLLHSVYIVPATSVDLALEFSRDQGEFVETTLPESLRAAFAAMEPTGGAGTPGLRSSQSLPDGTVLVVLPAYSESPGIGTAEPQGAVAAIVDAGLIHAQVIPALVNEHLKGFPYRVVDTSTGRVLASSLGGEPDRAPEVVVGLDSLLLFDARFLAAWRDAPGPSPWEGQRRSATLANDPSLRFWLLRGREDREQAPDPRMSEREGSRVRLEVYYPNRSLESVMARRRTFGIGVGVGIITVLLASAAVLYSLYRKTAGLRADEQEFVASMSHELRTPISVLHAMSDNLAEGVVTDPARLSRYARVIHGQVKRLSGMVESILFYSGLQSNSGKAPTLVEIQFPRLIQDVAHPLIEVAARGGSTLRVTEESLPPVICSDATALRLIIENLVTNAVRHADPGEIRLTVARRAFDILRITVEDDGPGIPQREQARIFDAFVRGERSVRGQRPGSGLGLHLVKRVAAMLGGSVTLESPYPNLAGIARPGCRFTATLPCKESCAHGDT